MRKKTRNCLIGILLLLVILVVSVPCFYTLREYRPEEKEALEVSDGTRILKQKDTVTVLTYNTGYAGLSQKEDFFMDGGTKVQPDSKELIEENLNGIASVLKEQEADCYFLQEVDLDSKRSYHIDEQKYYEDTLGLTGIFACNFKCDYVPYPFPPIGKVESGLVSITDLKVSEATRLALPESFRWPIKTCNLKRCILETRIPIEGTKKELVLLNFHLEAYDDGEGKIAQSRVLSQKLEEEYEKGNYVIAGGDFNQEIEGLKQFPIVEEGNWEPSFIGTKDIPDHFSFAASDEFPSCRLLNKPYTGNYEDSQVYVLDGFIVSDNLKVLSVKTIDTEFRWADHQPVRLEVQLKEESR